MLLSANIFQPLIDVFQSVVEFFHNDVGTSWGWSIVLLTISVRLVLVPLMLRQFHSMQAMQAHMPEMKAIQAKYKEDKQRQQQEMMKFYQENKINPLASCLPLVAQLPVFISLFYMLRKNLRPDICPGVQTAGRAKYLLAHPSTSKAALKAMTFPCNGHNGSGFLFIHDLTNQATGISLIVLLVLYVGTQMGTQVIMAQPTMDQNMRRMMMFLPILFIAFVYRFPAGVLVYWVTTNTWMLLQQAAFKARIGRLRASGALPMPPAPPPGGKGGGSGGRTGPKTGGSGGGGKSGTDIDYANLGNGAGSGPGLGRLLRPKPAVPAEPVKPVSRAGGPPPSSRKKKKRSGRRR